MHMDKTIKRNQYDDFSIHGGRVPGSAGCIDLTSNMDNFVALFDYIGNDLIIQVEY